MSRVRIDRRVYLTADRERAVDEGDPDARYLLCTAGGEVDRDLAARYGLLDKPEPEPAEPAEQEPEQVESKQRRPAANKQRAKPADKAT